MDGVTFFKELKRGLLAKDLNFNLHLIDPKTSKTYKAN
jgi:hypothetical protein